MSLRGEMRRGARDRAPLRPCSKGSATRLLVGAAATTLLLVGCTSEPGPVAGPSPGAQATPGQTEPQTGGGGHADRVDPREDGFDVAFGEFSVELEADVIRPGPVTFVIRNGGELVHGFEMEIEGEDDGFKVETETIGPGETRQLELDLSPGVYKVECFIEGHDDLGMEALLEVRRGAPLVGQGREAGDVFGSGAFGQGGTFSHRFGSAGTFAYRCDIHPTMQGTVVVAEG
jgi:plastocyanin